MPEEQVLKVESQNRVTVVTIHCILELAQSRS